MESERNACFEKSCTVRKLAPEMGFLLSSPLQILQ